MKPILCLDFDGVCHSYVSGWKGPAIIPDPHVPGLFEFINLARNHFSIHIFSSRSNQPGGIDAMRSWFVREMDVWVKTRGQWFPLDLQFPTEKPPAMISIDDRAVTFNGTWPAIETLCNFKPWNKK